MHRVQERNPYAKANSHKLCTEIWEDMEKEERKVRKEKVFILERKVLNSFF